jgi:hypothetical protein
MQKAVCPTILRLQPSHVLATPTFSFRTSLLRPSRNITSQINIPISTQERPILSLNLTRSPSLLPEMAEQSSTRVLLLGATGYMYLPPSPTSLSTSLTTHSGGSILTTLLAHPIADTLTISALVRKPYQASILKDAGVEPLIFKDLDDYEAIFEAAKDVDGTSLLFFIFDRFLMGEG